MVGHDAPNMDHSYYEKKEMSFDEWISIGLSRGWCGPPVCYTHDGLPMSDEEDAMWADGDDPCQHIIRLYEDEEHKAAVEKAHSPSMWRNHYTE